jgi:hypothetical protein
MRDLAITRSSRPKHAKLPDCRLHGSLLIRSPQLGFVDDSAYIDRCRGAEFDSVTAAVDLGRLSYSVRPCFAVIDVTFSVWIQPRYDGNSGSLHSSLAG